MASEHFLLLVILYNLIWRQYIWDRVPLSCLLIPWHPYLASSLTNNLPLHPSLSSFRCRQLSITSFSVIQPLQATLHYILLYHPHVTNILLFHPSRCILPIIWQLVWKLIKLIKHLIFHNIIQRRPSPSTLFIFLIFLLQIPFNTFSYFLLMLLSH